MKRINVELLPMDKVHPSAYNPRSADPERLKILELSLKKLGFIHPVFADANGELLSGHQRHLCATRLGFTHIPVLRLSAMTLAERKAINIAFNRGTNDLNSFDTSSTLKERLATCDPYEIASKLPDCPPDKIFRSYHPEYISTEKIVAANQGRWVRYARNMASVLYMRGVVMPIVCTPDLHIVNGIGRCELYASKHWEKIPVVFISQEEAEFSNIMLNYLSMDFDIHRRYADLLRHNSFRRPSGVKTHLGRSFTFALVGGKASKTFDLKNPRNIALWKKTYGTTVCDFGCGLMDETNILRGIGVNSIPFEPFFLDEKREISPVLSREIATNFLDKVASGISFDSIFLSAVLNSVPFLEDRKHVVCILNALCTGKTKVYAHAASDTMTHYTNVANSTGLRLDKSSMSLSKFVLDYEPRVTIGDYDNPKVQKYHTPKEFYDLWREFFASVQISESQNNVNAISANPVPVTKDRLVAALSHEFNLPYPDGSRMNMTEYAIQAFEKRVQITGRKFT